MALTPKEKVYRNREKKRQIINGIKAEAGCRFCGESDPVALDFHHLENKDSSIADMLATNKGINRILAEIDKCWVLCSNCHRKLHAGRFTGVV